ncbi:MAG TPA: hypothetical protein VM867_08475 [Xanthobacteraceae bacterium]|nr:hypothetical protein [Xanthobacteraceae bacterium]
MAANADDQSYLYYISDATCTDPYQHGYFGISSRASREREHRNSGKWPSGFAFTVMFRGTRRACAAVEKQYRPEPGIGWNKSSGGGRWRKVKR